MDFARVTPTEDSFHVEKDIHTGMNAKSRRVARVHIDSKLNYSNHS